MRANTGQPEQEIADPSDYKLVFEMSKSGELVLQDLMNRFCTRVWVEGGLDAARKTDFRCGRRAVVEFILAQIDQANSPTPIEPLEPTQE